MRRCISTGRGKRTHTWIDKNGKARNKRETCIWNRAYPFKHTFTLVVAYIPVDPPTSNFIKGSDMHIYTYRNTNAQTNILKFRPAQRPCRECWCPCPPAHNMVFTIHSESFTLHLFWFHCISFLDLSFLHRSLSLAFWASWCEIHKSDFSLLSLQLTTDADSMQLLNVFFLSSLVLF